MKDKKCTCKKGSDQDIDKTNVTMSVPEGFEYNKAYSIDDLKHSKYYYDYERNGPITSAFDLKLDLELKRIGELLKSKNKAYGNTALNPTNIFSKLDATEALCARLDDKLARIKNKGINDETEDTVSDLIGYLLLLKMSK
tara:strand:+ start:1055 stop:1474 length:420 start_codon:yes stop_codon:yes gene_type:complete